MFAKQFNLRSAMIVLLAITLVGGGCASLKPPILTPTQTVEEEGGGINLPSRTPAEEDLNPSGWKKAWEVTREVLRVLEPIIAAAR
jgi:hypothetical protein